MNFSDMKNLWEKCAEFCLDDGATTFGFGSHQGYDEVFVSKYKIFDVITKTPEKYEALLRQFGIPKIERLRTVWDNFTQDKPGCSHTVEVDGKNIYALVEELKEEEGLYFYEHQES